MIFQILADPARHRDLDGSGMLQGLVSGSRISSVGDVFVMKMYFTERADISHGAIWVESMNRTLERLDGLVHPAARNSSWCGLAPVRIFVAIDGPWKQVGP